MIWKKKPSLEELNRFSQNTMASHLGIEFTAVGEDSIEARMPVDERTHQPYGLLHGGASVALAETLGSTGAHLCVDAAQGYRCVGVEINANHIKSITQGWVTGSARPLHLGRSTQVWEIRITSPEQELVAVSRLTVAVIKPRA